MVPPGFVKPTKLLSSSERQAIYDANPEVRTLRDKVDDLMELTNEASTKFQTSEIQGAEPALRRCAQTAGALLKSMESYRPKPYSEPTDVQQVVMVMFVDCATCLSQVLLYTATLKEMLNSPMEALLLYQACLPQSDSIGDKESSFTCRVGVGNCHRALGQFEKAIDILRLEYGTAQIER
jgi:hypothetical protein